jgi:hypothetical protein
MDCDAPSTDARISLLANDFGPIDCVTGSPNLRAGARIGIAGFGNLGNNGMWFAQTRQRSTMTTAAKTAGLPQPGLRKIPI